ncbi:hypothetical protein [Aquimarina sp. RZ0]|uniref:hypothetical protein n=1 Tax=Aquimarina sp. RZ0 TaxID=2607730 RepID=UPI0011F16EC7|nr:hypothetical protein [Aquimarina sp. RZ0]KAA1241434.1 hypothetical protein F0000_26620 [Aquimarina sp. RZ0]
MKLSIVVFILSIVFSVMNVLTGQENLKTFTFKKGEVLDLILLDSPPNSEALFDRYKKTAFPIAFAYGYQPQPGFKISKLTMGTHLPASFIVGKWTTREKREGFLTNIVKKVPDFHSQRRKLFTYFGLTYYEILEDMEFSIDTSKYTVVTALWKKNIVTYTKFLKEWKAHISTSGGKIITTLKGGTSPVGYYYNPDTLIIAVWEDANGFQSFTAKYPLSAYEGLQNVHQFVID